MSEEEKEKVKDLLQKWLEEAKNIKDNNQFLCGTRLDNGYSGEYTKLTKKHQKLIGRKVWNI